jgi:hypothetical protein
MAQRTAQIIIDVDDKSLQELNQEIIALDKNIKSLKIGTQEWNAANQKLGDLKNKFQSATNEARKLQGQVEKISGAEQIRSIAKLGAGLVGTFATVSGSLKLLGVNSKAFDEMTAKATTLMSIMGGLNQISEMFSKANLAGLANIGKGFKGLVTTVKAASTGIKAALISTGIGALVVGVGLLIANFDKLKNLFADKKGLKVAEAEARVSAEILKQFEARLAAQKTIVDSIKATNVLLVDAKKNAEAEYGYALEENNLLKAKKTAIEKDNEYIDIQLKKRNKLKETEIFELEQRKRINDETYRGLFFEADILVKRLAIAKANMEIAAPLDVINKKLKEHQDKLIEINAQTYNQKKLYEQNRKILQDQLMI